ncbi:MAG: NlpC/P60 family protein, partial [Sporichthyaceae bacterium]|nr:NlpC/P60 family protein [Sporichthyaceae bacterium]
GINGLAVAMVAGGGYLVYSGVRNVPLVEGLRELAAGQQPTGRPAIVTPVTFGGQLGGSGNGSGPAPAGSSALADAAVKYLGIPYRFGGTDPGTGLDCSGLVYVCLKDIGINEPRRVSMGYRVWRGAVNIGRAQIRSGDLCCYLGHIGIAVSNSQMIHAPHRGAVVRYGPIDWSRTNPVLGRRLVGAGPAQQPAPAAGRSV